MSNPVFTIQNTTSEDVYFHVYHLGAGRIPWINGLPRVHSVLVPANSTRSYSPDGWIMAFDTILSIFIDAVITAGEIVLAVVTEGAAVPAEEEIDVELAFGEFWESIETVESDSSFISKIIDTSQEFFDSAASKFNLTPAQLGGIIKGGLIGGSAIVAGATLDKLLPGFNFYITNKQSTVFAPNQAIYDVSKNDGSTLFVVSSQEIDVTFDGIDLKFNTYSNAWTNVIDDITVSGGAGIWLNHLPGYSETSPSADS